MLKMLNIIVLQLYTLYLFILEKILIWLIWYICFINIYLILLVVKNISQNFQSQQNHYLLLSSSLLTSVLVSLMLFISISFESNSCWVLFLIYFSFFSVSNDLSCNWFLKTSTSSIKCFYFPVAKFFIDSTSTLRFIFYVFKSSSFV